MNTSECLLRQDGRFKTIIRNMLFNAFKSLLLCSVKHNKQISVSEIKVGVNYKMNMGDTERLVGSTDLMD